MPSVRSFTRALLTDAVRSVGLLTRVPVSGQWFEGFDGRYDRASRAFPLVGALLGLGAGLVALAALVLRLPSAVAAPLAIASAIVVTGALHEDGLADTADGLGARERERRLAIMRDSAIGTYGVLALLLVLALQTGALAALLHRPGAALAALVAAFALSRAGMVWLWHATSPARADGAAAASGRPRASSVRIAALIAALASLPALIALGPWPILLALGLLVVTLLGMRRLAHGLGGHTGDVLGACTVLAQTAVLVGSCGVAPPHGTGASDLAPPLPLADMRAQ